MRIESVEFVRSANGAGDLPGGDLPELAFAGRSNVGKSTLINALVRQPIARTSAEPGKTRLINLFRVKAAPGAFYLVDLPGYGFARGPREALAEFDRLAKLYFSRAGSARGLSDSGGVSIGVLLLVDARHPGLESDAATAAWLRSLGLDPLVVVTKLDKLPRSGRARALQAFELFIKGPVVGVSARTGEGMEDLWKEMASWIRSATHSRAPRPRP